MTSAVDIANLALSHIGQDANVSSIDPPEASVDAEHCARFYPIALGELLEEHPWTFATRRRTLALLASTITPWAYAYALPSDCLKTRRILSENSTDDLYGARFLVEDNILYTNVPNAVLVYTYRLVDTGRFPPKFVTALSWLLASHIAGPILKDTTGNAAQRAYAVYERELGKAKSSNANSDRNRAPYIPSSVAARFGNYSNFGQSGYEDYTYPAEVL